MVEDTSLQMMVQRLGGREPFEGFAWSGIQGEGDCVKISARVLAEVGGLWKVLAQETVGVFVRAALPRALRVTEADLKTCVDPQLRVLRHPGALIPRQGLPQAFGQGFDGTGNRIPDGCGPVTCEGWAVLYPDIIAVARHPGKVQQDCEPGGLFDQRADRRAAEPEPANEVAVLFADRRCLHRRKANAPGRRDPLPQRVFH